MGAGGTTTEHRWGATQVFLADGRRIWVPDPRDAEHRPFWWPHGGPPKDGYEDLTDEEIREYMPERND